MLSQRKGHGTRNRSGRRKCSSDVGRVVSAGASERSPRRDRGQSSYFHPRMLVRVIICLDRQGAANPTTTQH